MIMFLYSYSVLDAGYTVMSKETRSLPSQAHVLMREKENVKR